MPVYVCLRGDCSNLATLEPDCFVLADALGREWLCYETDLQEIPAEIPEQVFEMLQAQGLAHKHGHGVEGSTTSEFVARDREDLARQLVLNTYPPPEKSAARLAHVDWQNWREEFGTGQPYRVTLSKGWWTVEAEGGNKAEAWYRLAQKAQKEQPPVTLPFYQDPIPLRADEQGGLRVGRSRVLLDTVIREYEGGLSAEGIREAYPALELADVYAVLAYYFRHKDDVTAYLAQRRAEADELQQRIEATQPDRDALKEKLLARQKAREQAHASSRG